MVVVVLTYHEHLFIGLFCLFQLTVQLALIGLMEYLLHLTKLYPDMMYVHQDSGLINVAYFKFSIDDAKGTVSSLFITWKMDAYAT